MYVAVKGGERAILNSYRMLDDYRRGDREVPELSLAQIREQMPLAVSRVMSEGSLYDPQLAALALKQAAGDAIEAVFLLRAYRTTLSRFGYTQPLDTGRMRLQRRISSTFRTCRAARSWGRPTITPAPAGFFAGSRARGRCPAAGRGNAGLVHAARHRPAGARRPDRSRAAAGRRSRALRPDAPAAGFSADRAARLQNLARADEGFLLSMGYSTQRGYGNTHPFAAEIRYGALEVEMHIEELGFAVTVGEIEVTRMPDGEPVLGQCAGRAEVHARLRPDVRLWRAQGHVDGAGGPGAEGPRPGEAGDSPANDHEFVLYHSDNVEGFGFRAAPEAAALRGLQANLELLRRMRGERLAAAAARNDLMDEAVTP